MIDLFGSGALLLPGLLLVLQSGKVAKVLQNFYSNYPFIRYAGIKQLTSRSVFVVVPGVYFIAIGATITILRVFNYWSPVVYRSAPKNAARQKKSGDNLEYQNSGSSPLFLVRVKGRYAAFTPSLSRQPGNS